MSSPTHLINAVRDAKSLVTDAIAHDNLAQALTGFKLFSEAMITASMEGRFRLASSLVSEMLGAFKLPELIENFRLAKISDSLFEACITVFPPSARDIEDLEKGNTRLDIDLMLVNALLAHEDLDAESAIGLAEDLAHRASHQALGVVLKLFFQSYGEEPTNRPFSWKIFRVMNKYGKDYPAGKKLPHHLIDLLIHHQRDLLAINRKCLVHHMDDSMPIIAILKQISTRGGQELVDFMAPKWAFVDTDDNSLLELEGMGFTISLSNLSSTLAGAPSNPHFSCAAHYALHSRLVDTDQLRSLQAGMGSKHVKWLKALSAIYENHPKAKRSELLEHKLRQTLLALASLQPLPKGYPDALLNIKGLGREEALDIPALAEIVLCSDLGL